MSQTQCPKCGKFLAFFDPYFQAWRCQEVACRYFYRPDRRLRAAESLLDDLLGVFSAIEAVEKKGDPDAQGDLNRVQSKLRDLLEKLKSPSESSRENA